MLKAQSLLLPMRESRLFLFLCSYPFSMASFVSRADRTDSITGTSASASCSLHSPINSRSCWSAGASRCNSGLKTVRASIRSARSGGVQHVHFGIGLVVLYIHHRPHIDFGHIGYLILRQAALIAGVFYRITQRTGKIIHRNSPQRYFTIHHF